MVQSSIRVQITESTKNPDDIILVDVQYVKDDEEKLLLSVKLKGMPEALADLIPIIASHTAILPQKDSSGSTVTKE